MEIKNENNTTTDYNENIKERIMTEDGTELLIMKENKYIREGEMNATLAYGGITISKLESVAEKGGWAHDGGRLDFQEKFDTWNTEYHLLEGRKVGIAGYTYIGDNNETIYTIMSYEQLYNYLEIEVRDYIEEYGEQHENVVITKNADGIIKEWSGYSIAEENYRRVDFLSKEQAIKFAKDKNLEVIGYEERTLTKSLEKVRVNLEISEDRYNTNGDKPWFDTSGYKSRTKLNIELKKEIEQKEKLRQIEEMVRNS